MRGRLLVFVGLVGAALRAAGIGGLLLPRGRGRGAGEPALAPLPRRTTTGPGRQAAPRGPGRRGERGGRGGGAPSAASASACCPEARPSCRIRLCIQGQRSRRIAAARAGGRRGAATGAGRKRTGSARSWGTPSRSCSPASPANAHPAHKRLIKEPIGGLTISPALTSLSIPRRATRSASVSMLSLILLAMAHAACLSPYLNPSARLETAQGGAGGRSIRHGRRGGAGIDRSMNR